MSDHTISAYKAAGLVASDEVPSLTIVLDLTIPKGRDESIADIRQRFENDGKELATALWETLPGGTLDALVSHLLARRASSLRVSFGTVTKEQPDVG